MPSYSQWEIFNFYDVYVSFEFAMNIYESTPVASIDV